MSLNKLEKKIAGINFGHIYGPFESGAKCM